MTEHLPIQHYVAANANPVRPDEATHYRHLVTYADHIEALRACEERVLDAAREAVEELLKEWWEKFEGKPDDLKELKSMVELNRAIAAIDALREDQR